MKGVNGPETSPVFECSLIIAGLTSLIKTWIL